MKMATFEKRFVNAPAHSRRVADHAVRRLLRVPLQAGWRYLDVGCGNGVATFRAAESFGLRAVGVDVDPGQIALARRAADGTAGVAFMTANATRLPFDRASFNIVATSRTMHHLADWPLAVEELRRVVMTGGYLVFTDLTVPAPLRAVLHAAIGRHTGVFTSRELDRAFAGLVAVHRHVGWLHYDALFTQP
jgi:ubiquinone/menaquinone biosynthesis C-methylase UbiE